MRCQRCGYELENLTHIRKVTEFADCYLEDDELQYDHEDSESDITDQRYECPKCNILLASDEKEAIAILKGELTLELSSRFLEIALGNEYEMKGGEKKW